jgi:hypothetical protein
VSFVVTTRFGKGKGEDLDEILEYFIGKNGFQWGVGWGAFSRYHHHSRGGIPALEEIDNLCSLQLTRFFGCATSRERFENLVPPGGFLLTSRVCRN